MGYAESMGRRNYLIEGVSCSGKTTVCNKLRERGYHVINGDTELAYQGDPLTGEAVEGHAHEHLGRKQGQGLGCRSKQC